MQINASRYPCPVLYRPTDPAYAEHIRHYQGCPTLAVTKGGRIYLGWYSGGTQEPHMENYNLLICSDDLGKTWSAPLLVIPSVKERCVHALDIQLWTDPDGALHVYWVQNDTHPVSEGIPGYTVDGYVFNDSEHSEWVIVCADPDAADPVFTEPRRLDQGFLRCKPTVLPDGAWLNFNYDQMTDRYGYSISRDKGETWTRYYGAKKIPTPFDEGMAYVKENGDIRMFARTSVGELAESVSHDNALTWDPAVCSGIDSPNTRFFVARTPTGRILLVNNDHRSDRCRMTLYLSEDDGAAWKYKRCIDARGGLSYPDADFYNGEILLTYDRERTGAKEILFVRFTEEDIMDASRPIVPQIVSKP